MSEPVTPRRGLILVADDDPCFREAFAQMLSLRGYETAFAGSREEIRRALHERRFDLLSLDLDWEGRDYDGIVILREVQQIDRLLPVVMVTGHGSIPTAVEATRLGAFDYIEKSPDREKALLTIKNALEAGRLRRENEAYLNEIRAKFAIVGESPAIRQLRDQIHKAAPSESVVLITGASGTGKELVARQVHYHSARRERAFVPIDSGTLCDALAESELFGHKRGAFTGAVQDRPGLVAAAEGGTLFLDEVTNASPSVQAKLLHLLQEKEYRRVGEDRMRPCNVRIIAASNQHLPDLVEAGRFREDLYYRLKVIEIYLPPLCERTEDIGLLIDHFLKVKSRQSLSRVRTLAAEARLLLLNYPWPGNVREVENTVERLLVMSEGEEITPDDVRAVSGLAGDGGSIPGRSLQEMTHRFRRECIIKAMALAGGSVTRAAEILHVDRKHLHRLVRDIRLTDGP